jgi:class 3 adenylate cyclase
MTDRSVTREQLEQAIAAQEQLRGTLDDTVVDAAIGALRAHLDLLEADEAVAPRRRLATVMFVDIVDSTGLLRDRDPEETMTIMDSALQRLAAPVRRHGGRVTRFMGDGYLAVFGLPTSRENDPEMAVRAGLAVLDETTVVADELAKTHGLGRLGVRIGINTGLVVTGGSTEAADTIMGAEVNLAARLETAAPPNGLLISHGTYQHVRDRFVVERRGTIEAKGFLEPVAVYLVTGIEEPTRRGARPVVEGITAAFAGRDGELLGLERALDEAIGGAALTTVSVCGDAGIGKSRTVREFEDRLPSEVRTFRARAAAEDRDVPYALLKDLLVRYLGIRDGDGLEIVTGKLRAGTAETLDDDQATAVGRLVGFEIGDRPASDPKRLRDVGLRALGDLLRPTTQANVIVLEDLQWADEASLDAVDGLMAQLMMTPTLVVLVARPTFWAEQPRWDLAPGHRRIDVPPLDTSTCRSLVDDLLADVEGDTEAVAELLMTRSEGNPYYLEELVRMLVDDGVLVRAEGHWSTSAGELTGLRVPPTLTGVIQSRLDGLDRRERAALQRSSVIGRVFWEGAVVHLGGDGSALADLVDRDMIVAHATSAFGDTAEYAFRHTLLREVAYESVLLADRARLHGLAADWLADRAGERAGEFAGPIATHLEQAGRPAEAVGYLMRAAEIAWRSYAIDATVAFYRRAQDLAGDGATRCDIALGLAQAFRVQGDRVAEDALLTDAEEIARSAGDVVRVSRTLLQRAWYHYWNSDFDGMERAAEASAAAASDLEAPAALASARIARAWALMVLRRLPEAAAEAAAAEVVAREVGDRDVERSALNAVGLIAIASAPATSSTDTTPRREPTGISRARPMR